MIATIGGHSDCHGPGIARPATLRLLQDNRDIAADDLPATPFGLFSIIETFEVGLDTGSPAGTCPAASEPGYRWRGGAIDGVSIELR